MKRLKTIIVTVLVLAILPTSSLAEIPTGAIAQTFNQQSPNSVFCLMGCDVGIKADLNHDGVINIFDLVILGLHWGTHDSIADVNGDGNVDILDLTIMGSFWNQRFY